MLSGYIGSWWVRFLLKREKKGTDIWHFVGVRLSNTITSTIWKLVTHLEGDTIQISAPQHFIAFHYFLMFCEDLLLLRNPNRTCNNYQFVIVPKMYNWLYGRQSRRYSNPHKDLSGKWYYCDHKNFRQMHIHLAKTT